MDAIDILGLMKNHPPPEPVSLSAIPVLLAQAIADIAAKLTVTELDKLISAGAALYAAGVAETIAAGVDKARIALDSGAARAKLDQLVAATNAF